MSEHAKYEEKITIIKGSTDSLHIRIPYNPAYIQRIRQITGRQWESRLKVWIIPYTTAAVQEFINQFDPMMFRLPRSYGLRTKIYSNGKLVEETSSHGAKNSCRRR